MKKILLISFISTSLFTQNIGTIQTIIGKVEVKRNKKIMTVIAGCKLEENDILMTKTKSSMTVLLNDGKLLVLGSKTLLSISKYLSTSIEKRDKPDVNESQEQSIEFDTLFLKNYFETTLIAVESNNASVEVEP